MTQETTESGLKITILKMEMEKVQKWAKRS